MDDTMYGDEEMSPEAPPEDDTADLIPAEEPKEEPEAPPIDPTVSLEQMRCCWKFASIIQFCRMFSAPLNLKAFSADMLEKALMDPGEHLVFISELVYKLVRRDAVRDYREGDNELWEDVLHKKFLRQWRQIMGHNPLRTKAFMDLPPMTRVQVLYGLCDWRAHECRVVKDTMRIAVESPEYTADALRHYPIGEDSKGSKYYYFASNYEDCRLYREDPPKVMPANKKRLSKEEAEQQEMEEAGWFTHCITLEDVQKFVETLAGSRNKHEKRLHDILASQIVPKLIETAASRKRAEERAAVLEAMPKRSDRLHEVAKKKEEEEKVKQLHEEEIRLQREARMKLKAAGLHALLNANTAHLTREERFQLRQSRLWASGEDFANGYYSSDAEEPLKRRKYQHSPGWSPLAPAFDLVFRKQRSGVAKRKTNLDPVITQIKSVMADVADADAGSPASADDYDYDDESAEEGVEEHEEYSEEGRPSKRARKPTQVGRRAEDSGTPATLTRLRERASRGKYADFVVDMFGGVEDYEAQQEEEDAQLDMSEPESEETRHRDRPSRSRHRTRSQAHANGDTSTAPRTRSTQPQIPHVPPSTQPPAVQNVTRFPVQPGPAVGPSPALPTPPGPSPRPQQLVPNQHRPAVTPNVVTGSVPHLSHLQQQSISQISNPASKPAHLSSQGPMPSQVGQPGSGSTPAISPLASPRPGAPGGGHTPAQAQLVEMYKKLPPQEMQYVNAAPPAQRHALLIHFTKQRQQQQAKLAMSNMSAGPPQGAPSQVLSTSHPQVSVTPPLQHNLAVPGMQHKTLQHPGSLPSQIQPGQLKPGQMQLNNLQFGQSPSVVQTQANLLNNQFQSSQLQAKLGSHDHQFLMQQRFLQQQQQQQLQQQQHQQLQQQQQQQQLQQQQQQQLQQGVVGSMQQAHQQHMSRFLAPGNVAAHSLFSTNPILSNLPFSLNPSQPLLSSFNNAAPGMLNLPNRPQGPAHQRLYPGGTTFLPGASALQNSQNPTPVSSTATAHQPLSLSGTPASSTSNAQVTHATPSSLPPAVHPLGGSQPGLTMSSFLSHNTTNPAAVAFTGPSLPPGSLPSTAAILGGAAASQFRGMQGMTNPQMAAAMLQMRAAGSTMHSLPGAGSAASGNPSSTATDMLGSTAANLPVSSPSGASLPASAPNGTISHSGMSVNHPPSGPAVK